MEDWKVYERMVAQLFVDQLNSNLCVTPNARVIGRYTRVARQIDVLIDFRHDTDNRGRSIVEAKRRKRAIDVKDVEALLGMMDDVEARFGYLVCPTGYSDGAFRRAQDTVRICLVPLDRIQDFDPAAWPSCRRPGCSTGHIFWDGYPQVELLAKPANAPCAPSRLLAYPQKVGKCDACRMCQLGANLV